MIRLEVRLFVGAQHDALDRVVLDRHERADLRSIHRHREPEENKADTAMANAATAALLQQDGDRELHRSRSMAELDDRG